MKVESREKGATRTRVNTRGRDGALDNESLLRNRGVLPRRVCCHKFAMISFPECSCPFASFALTGSAAVEAWPRDGVTGDRVHGLGFRTRK